MKSSRIYGMVLVAVLATAAVLTSTLAQPAKPAGGPIAVCDLVDVFNNYQRAKDETAKLNERRQQIKAEMEKRTKAIDTLKAERDSYKEGSKKHTEITNQIIWKSLQDKTWLQYQDNIALTNHRDLTKEMYDEIKAMIAAVAQRRGVSVVLQREPETLQSANTAELLRQIQGRKVLYASEKLDITETVLLSLNQAYKTKAPTAAPKKP